MVNGIRSTTRAFGAFHDNKLLLPPVVFVGVLPSISSVGAAAAASSDLASAAAAGLLSPIAGATAAAVLLFRRSAATVVGMLLLCQRASSSSTSCFVGVLLCRRRLLLFVLGHRAAQRRRQLGQLFSRVSTLFLMHNRPSLLWSSIALQKGDLSVIALLSKAKGIADTLQLASHRISPAEFNAIIFHKLGAEFNGIIGALQQRSEPPSYQDLLRQLVSYEVLLHAQQPVLQPSAMLVQSPPAPTPPQFSRAGRSQCGGRRN
ncbi:OLC1v1036055C1 [Oldenlandia corymbosa var. corymbosa]|uniref:OLC1v1036055C1 n=1 Tax=Oldenlandia corymbosa var. corymbosa TaxID=529605 RepID=A0AAV1CXW0_OLDCO|nr:OLC1v1036055C1 [Oldenlandia corymbosa var. corymbosa]